LKFEEVLLLSQVELALAHDAHLARATALVLLANVASLGLVGLVGALLAVVLASDCLVVAVHAGALLHCRRRGSIRANSVALARRATRVTCRTTIEECTTAAITAITIARRNVCLEKSVNGIGIGIDLNYGKAVRGKNSTISHWDCCRNTKGN